MEWVVRGRRRLAVPGFPNHRNTPILETISNPPRPVGLHLPEAVDDCGFEPLARW